ncbi:MAG: epoxyqueuosine reductase QueH [Candidatus Omnitrophota bacterium]
MDILLHICCAPCLIYPFSSLNKKKFRIKGFYYNPNIYPSEEYIRRKSALGVVGKHLKIDVEYPDYVPADYFHAITCNQGPHARCAICFMLRLKKTAEFAKTNGFKAFSTTLLVSPYQDHELLKDCGGQVAREAGVDFYYEDFRVGFNQAQIEAKELKIYRQKYCGCKYSIKK